MVVATYIVKIQTEDDFHEHESNSERGVNRTVLFLETVFVSWSREKITIVSEPFRLVLIRPHSGL